MKTPKLGYYHTRAKPHSEHLFGEVDFDSHESTTAEPKPNEIEEIWKTQFPQFPLPELRGVKNLCVMWIDRGSAFKIMQMNGAEYIYNPCDDPSWVIA